MPQGPGPRIIIKRNGDYVTKEIPSIFDDSRRRSISDFAPIFRNVAKTSHFQVEFGGSQFSFPQRLGKYLKKRGIENEFISDTVGLMCYSASIPGSSSTTTDIMGNRTGIVEQFARTRTYDPLSLSFYVDNEYKVLTFFESWIEFIHNASDDFNQTNIVNDDYFVRNHYPEEYKVDQTKIYKFDNDYRNVTEYNYRKLFPKSIVSVPLDYQASNIMKMTVSFSYERYIPGQTTSISVAIKKSNNRR